MEFQLPTGTMCHRREADLKRPKTWRHIHLECSRCFGSKTLCSLLFGNPPPIKIWLCLPCERAQPDIREIIAANSMKDLP